MRYFYRDASKCLSGIKTIFDNNASYENDKIPKVLKLFSTSITENIILNWK